MAPAHRSRHTVAYLAYHVPEFIEPENWPPYSPDLNPVELSLGSLAADSVSPKDTRH